VVVTDPERLQGLAEHGDFTQPIRDSAATIALVQEPGGNMFDIGRAAQNIMLAAKTVGVASCPITFHRDAQARAFLGAPAGTVTRYAVALGYPAAAAEPRRYGGRKQRDDIVRREGYTS
jgi:nitroreductase